MSIKSKSLQNSLSVIDLRGLIFNIKWILRNTICFIIWTFFLIISFLIWRGRESVIIRGKSGGYSFPHTLITLIRFSGTLKNIKMIWKIILDPCWWDECKLAWDGNEFFSSNLKQNFYGNLNKVAYFFLFILVLLDGGYNKWCNTLRKNMILIGWVLKFFKNDLQFNMAQRLSNDCPELFQNV